MKKTKKIRKYSIEYVITSHSESCTGYLRIGEGQVNMKDAKNINDNKYKNKK